jgi:hypothetical protein
MGVTTPRKPTHQGTVGSSGIQSWLPASQNWGLDLYRKKKNLILQHLNELGKETFSR